MPVAVAELEVAELEVAELEVAAAVAGREESFASAYGQNIMVSAFCSCHT